MSVFIALRVFRSTNRMLLSWRRASRKNSSWYESLVHGIRFRRLSPLTPLEASSIAFIRCRMNAVCSPAGGIWRFPMEVSKTPKKNVDIWICTVLVCEIYTFFSIFNSIVYSQLQYLVTWQESRWRCTLVYWRPRIHMLLRQVWHVPLEELRMDVYLESFDNMIPRTYLAVIF